MANERLVIFFSLFSSFHLVSIYIHEHKHLFLYMKEYTCIMKNLVNHLSRIKLLPRELDLLYEQWISIWIWHISFRKNIGYALLLLLFEILNCLQNTSICVLLINWKNSGIIGDMTTWTSSHDWEQCLSKDRRYKSWKILPAVDT